MLGEFCPFRGAVVVHGGAWAVPDASADASKKGVEVAALAGAKVLKDGGNAIDAVEAAVRSMELNPVFDAGIGSVLNLDGEVEMDAIIMEGAKLRTGAVAGVSSVLHPVSVARAVMQHTEHGLLCGKGADAFAVRRGCEAATKDELVTPAAKEEWKRFKQYGNAVDGLFNKAEPSGHDTVGAVCIDSTGLIAVATSTGGITAKMPGLIRYIHIVYVCTTYLPNYLPN